MNAYVVCSTCKLGTLDRGKVTRPCKTIEHALELVPEAIFLSEHLVHGYKDPKQPHLEPIKLRFAPNAALLPSSQKLMPYGAPKSLAERTIMHRRLARREPVAVPQPAPVIESRPIVRSQRWFGGRS